MSDRTEIADLCDDAADAVFGRASLPRRTPGATMHRPAATVGAPRPVERRTVATGTIRAGHAEINLAPDWDGGWPNVQPAAARAFGEDAEADQ